MEITGNSIAFSSIIFHIFSTDEFGFELIILFLHDQYVLLLWNPTLQVTQKSISINKPIINHMVSIKKSHEGVFDFNFNTVEGWMLEEYSM